MKENKGKNRIIRLATEKDKEKILALYKAQIVKPFCVWSEHYPTIKEIDFDLSREALFVMVKEDTLVATISLDDDPFVKNLPCWTKSLQPGGEISRIAVADEYKNQGIARQMIAYAMDVLKERDFVSCHYLVRKENLAALKSYEQLAFTKVGECKLDGHPYWCYEKVL